MSSFTSAAAGGAVALYQALTGSRTLVQFCDGYGNTIVQFDAAMNESYQMDTAPTQFPVEDGSTISDHVVRSPFTMSLTAMVTDTPLGGIQGLVQEAATVAATATLPPLGVVAAAAAYAVWQAHAGATSPSQAAYAALLKLQQGDLYAIPPVPPEPFSVITKLGAFDNMVITSLSVPRDASTGGALSFDIKLTQITVVAPQTIDVTVLDKPGLAGLKATVGDQEAEKTSRLKELEEQGIVDGRAADDHLLGSIQ